MSEFFDLSPSHEFVRDIAGPARFLDAEVVTLDPLTVKIGDAAEAVDAIGFAVQEGESGLVLKQGTRIEWMGGREAPAKLSADIANALGWAQSSSAWMSGTAATGPGTRPGGEALQPGDMYAQEDPDDDDSWLSIQQYDGENWRTHKLVVGSLEVPGAAYIAEGALNFQSAIGLDITSGVFRTDYSASLGGYRAVLDNGNLKWEKDDTTVAAQIHHDATHLILQGGPSGMGAYFKLGASGVRLAAETAGGLILSVSDTNPIAPAGTISFVPGGPTAPKGYWSVMWNESLDKTVMRYYGPGGSGTGGDDMPQTTNAANVHVAVNGILYRSSSARKHKLDILDYDGDPYRLLGVPVRTWVDKTQHDINPDYTDRTIGLVAEEVLDAGLEEFVAFEADGSPAGVDYDRGWLPLIPIVRDVLARLDALEAP